MESKSAGAEPEEPASETRFDEAESLALTGAPDLFLRAKTPGFRRVTAALVAAGFSTYALMYCVQPLLPVFSADLHVSPAASPTCAGART
jgi:YNFM family putative membrane transporter